MTTSAIEAMSNKELIDLYNKMAETAGLRGKEVTQVKRFKDHATAVARTRKLGEWIASTGNGKSEDGPKTVNRKEELRHEASAAAASHQVTKVEAVKKPRKAGAAKEPRPKKAEARFGEDLVIIEVVENRRFKNTISHRHYEEMARYMEKHPNASVDDVITNTSYRRQDFDHDLRVGSIKTRKK